jgi:hypothetical protein
VGVAGAKQPDLDVRLGQVEPGHQSGLEQDAWAPAVRHGDAVELDTDMPGALQHVNARVRVARVDVHLLVFFEPRVHRVPVEPHVIDDPADR